MTPEDRLESLLESCSRCVEHSRTLWERSCESIQTSKSAVSASRALLVQSDLAIERLRMILDSPAIKAGGVASKAQQFEPVTVSGREFNDESIALDGKRFIDCSFSNCTLRYGGQAVIVETTSFRGCRFLFHSEAASTVQFLECFGLMTPGTDTEYSQIVQTDSRKPLPN